MIFFEKAQNGIHIAGETENTPCGLLRIFMTRPGNDNFYKPVPLYPSRISSSGDSTLVCWRCQDNSAGLELSLKKTGWGYTCNVSAKGCGHAVFSLEWELPEGVCHPFVPAFMYGMNEGGKSPWAVYPQLCKKGTADFGKFWASEEWLVRTDRSSHGFTSMLGLKRSYALGGSDVCRYADGSIAEKTGIGIGGPEVGKISFSMGFCNVPYTYSVIPGRNYHCRPEGYVNLDRGSVCAEVAIFILPGGEISHSAGRLLRESYALFHRETACSCSLYEGGRDVAEALAQYGYSKEAKNFYITLTENTSQMSRLPGLSFNTGWAGGVRAAYPLLTAGYRYGSGNWTDIARSVLDNIAENAISPSSGLFFENYEADKKEWNTRGWWYRMLEKPGHSGYINGQTCYFLLASFNYEQSRTGRLEYRWLNAALKVLDKAVSTQGMDGRFGYTYRESDGAILDGEGFCGCWFLPALALAWSVTDRKAYLESAEKAFAFYKRYVQDFNAFGGPHDIFKSPDEEGVLAFIKGARLLHMLTGAGIYLDALLLGLDYEFSWKFCYDVANEVEPLKSKGWSSTGGSVTSVNNSHIHPMGSSILSDIAYAVENTGDKYLESRFMDTLDWTLNAYLHFDGDYGWGKKGMINERFCYTDSLLAERFPDGSPASTWFCGHSWASGAVLEGLMEIMDFIDDHDGKIRKVLEYKKRI